MDLKNYKTKISPERSLQFAILPNLPSSYPQHSDSKQIGTIQLPESTLKTLFGSICFEILRPSIRNAIIHEPSNPRIIGKIRGYAVARFGEFYTHQVRTGVPRLSWLIEGLISGVCILKGVKRKLG